MKPKFLVGGAVIALALGYMIWAGVTQSAVYFVTPSELSAAPVDGKAYRLGGLVERGTLKWNPATLDLTFSVSDGKTVVPVRHKGAPDPGQALRGVQSAARHERGPVQGPHQTLEKGER